MGHAAWSEEERSHARSRSAVAPTAPPDGGTGLNEPTWRIGDRIEATGGSDGPRARLGGQTTRLAVAPPSLPPQCPGPLFWVPRRGLGPEYAVGTRLVLALAEVGEGEG
jgi:hypothetical protein